MMDVNTLHFERVIEGWVTHRSFIHLDFRLEPPARRSLSRLAERFRRSRLFDLSLCFRLDLSRSLARLRRTGDVDLLLLLERPISYVCELFLKNPKEPENNEKLNVCLYYAFSRFK